MADTIRSRNGFGILMAIFFVALSALAAREMRAGPVSTRVGEQMQEVVDSAKFAEYDNLPIRTHYTGIAGVDYGLRFLVTAFLPGAAGWDKGIWIQQLYFLISFFPIIGIYSVEAGRKRNSLALTSFTTIWALFYQTVGGAVIIPLYCLAYMRDSSRPNYYSRASRQVPLAYAKALLPSLLVGYLIPTVLMYQPSSDPGLSTIQFLVAFWQPTPIFVNLLLFVISTLYAKGAPKEQWQKQSPGQPSDLVYLKAVYTVFFIVSATCHVGTIITCLGSKNLQLDLTHAFIPQLGMTEPSLSEGLLYIFQVDFWIIFAASLGWAYLTVWDLKRIGKTDVSMVKAAAAITLATLFVGPAAAISGVWFWREQAMLK